MRNTKNKTKKNLTTRQNLFLKEYMQTGNATEAAMKVYNCKDRASAAALGSRMLRNVKIFDEVEFWLNKLGITDREIAKTIKEGLQATKVISAVSTNKDADEKTMDFIDVPDWNARNKTLEMLLKMRGKFIDKSINLNMDYKDVLDEIKKTIEEGE